MIFVIYGMFSSFNAKLKKNEAQTTPFANIINFNKVFYDKNHF